MVETYEGIIDTCYTNTQYERKDSIKHLLQCAGCYVVESEDTDLDVTNPKEPNCKKILDTLKEQGFTIIIGENKIAHIHSNIRKNYSWFQRW